MEINEGWEYEVEKLLRLRWKGTIRRRTKEVLVLWKDYSIDDASWIPTTNFVC